jgi:hypothetical protein
VEARSATCSSTFIPDHPYNQYNHNYIMQYNYNYIYTFSFHILYVHRYMGLGYFFAEPSPNTWMASVPCWCWALTSRPMMPGNLIYCVALNGNSFWMALSTQTLAADGVSFGHCAAVDPGLPEDHHEVAGGDFTPSSDISAENEPSPVCPRDFCATAEIDLAAGAAATPIVDTLVSAGVQPQPPADCRRSADKTSSTESSHVRRGPPDKTTTIESNLSATALSTDLEAVIGTQLSCSLPTGKAAESTATATERKLAGVTCSGELPPFKRAAYNVETSTDRSLTTTVCHSLVAPIARQPRSPSRCGFPGKKTVKTSVAATHRPGPVPSGGRQPRSSPTCQAPVKRKPAAERCLTAMPFAESAASAGVQPGSPATRGTSTNQQMATTHDCMTSAPCASPTANLTGQSKSCRTWRGPANKRIRTKRSVTSDFHVCRAVDDAPHRRSAPHPKPPQKPAPVALSATGHLCTGSLATGLCAYSTELSSSAADKLATKKLSCKKDLSTLCPGNASAAACAQQYLPRQNRSASVANQKCCTGAGQRGGVPAIAAVSASAVEVVSPALPARSAPALAPNTGPPDPGLQGTVLATDVCCAAPPSCVARTSSTAPAVRSASVHSRAAASTPGRPLPPGFSVCPDPASHGGADDVFTSTTEAVDITAVLNCPSEIPSQARAHQAGRSDDGVPPGSTAASTDGARAACAHADRKIKQVSSYPTAPRNDMDPLLPTRAAEPQGATARARTAAADPPAEGTDQALSLSPLFLRLDTLLSSDRAPSSAWRDCATNSKPPIVVGEHPTLLRTTSAKTGRLHDSVYVPASGAKTRTPCPEMAHAKYQVYSTDIKATAVKALIRNNEVREATGAAFVANNSQAQVMATVFLPRCGGRRSNDVAFSLQKRTSEMEALACSRSWRRMLTEPLGIAIAALRTLYDGFERWKGRRKGRSSAGRPAFQCSVMFTALLWAVQGLWASASMQPSGQPTGTPSRQPTSQPSRQPTGRPSHRPLSERAGDVDLATWSKPGKGLEVWGTEPDDRLGNSVADAGDVNDDGYRDILIGAYGADLVTDAGAAYLVFGSGSRTTSVIDTAGGAMLPKAIKITGANTADTWGISVSGVGDFNKDGIDDFIVGGHGFDPPSRTDAGAAVVIFGKTSGWADINLASFTSGSAGFWIWGAATDDRWGSFTRAGDVNGDGTDDIIMGSTGADPQSRSRAGSSYVIFGYSAGTYSTVDLSVFSSGSAGFKILGAAAGDYSGGGAGAGDVNGDGYSDVIVAAYGYDGPGGTDCGAAYVIFGHSTVTAFTDIDLATLSSSQGFRITGAAANDNLGSAVSSAGDFNNDGHDDIIVGSAGNKAYILFGHSNATAFPNVDLISFTAGTTGFMMSGSGSFGIDVRGGVDVNNDGVDDVALTAAYYAPAGVVYVLFGRSQTQFINIDVQVALSSEIGYRIVGAASSMTGMWSVALVRDFDGDGVGDVVIGAQQGDPSNRADAGIAYLIYGELSAPSSQPSTQPSAQPSRLPTSQPSGRPTSQPSRQPSSQPSAEPTAPTSQPSRRPSAQPSSRPTSQPSQQPVSLPTSQPSRQPTSRPSAYPSRQPTGTPSRQPTSQPSSQPTGRPSHRPLSERAGDVDLATWSKPGQGLEVWGTEPDDRLGGIVADAGDVNHDGYQDVLVGAYSAGLLTNAGAAYLVFGSASRTTSVIDTAGGAMSTKAVKISGATAREYWGISVSGVGDFNKDGIDDFIVGAHGFDPSSREDAGGAVVIFGKTSGWADIDLASFTSGSAGFWIWGAAAGDLCGSALSGAGDVNGDGADDIVVGVRGGDPQSKSGAGTAYVIFGFSAGVYSLTDLSAFSSGSAGFKILGAAAGDASGGLVAGAGDINGDGYGDVLVAAYGYDGPGGTDCGAAYVIFGHSTATAFTDIDLATLSSSHGFRVTGAAVNDNLGSAVSSAGDFNNDGHDDIVIGSAGNKAYILFGHSNATAFPNVDLISFTAGTTGFMMSGSGSFGIDVRGGVDVNNDGVDDVALTAAYYAPAGVVYVLFGRSQTQFINIDVQVALSSEIGYRIVGAASSMTGMWSVALVRDFDGDGVGDVVIGAQQGDPSNRAEAGTAYLIYGELSAPSSQPSTQPSAQPSRLPTSQPSGRPTAQPSRKPSSQPSAEPTAPTSQPSSRPSAQPSSRPTGQLSGRPSGQPSCKPTGLPSTQPSSLPTGQPTLQPTARPSTQPSSQPSGQPSRKPSARPSTQPSSQPSGQPSCKPSARPSTQPSSQPSGQPSCKPTARPSTQPSSQPSGQPSCKPTARPSTQPSSQPSGQPSCKPSARPSTQPSSQPSGQPSCKPSVRPSTQPSSQPSGSPSRQPTARPSTQPSSQPSGQPSGKPTARPSTQPSSLPTGQPTLQPTARPSTQPSSQPSGQPSCKPTAHPSTSPSSQPTLQPTALPSTRPSCQPSGQPTLQPTACPSTRPSSQPSGQPSCKPTARPSARPSSQPTYHPSSQPSALPSSQPTARPSGQPSGQPAASPSSQPTTSPTGLPSCQPSSQPTTAPSRPTAAPTLSTCAPGTFYANASAPNMCIKCAPGTYSNTYGGVAECTPCPLGQFAKDAGATECSKCATGYYADRNGTVTCTPCVAGTFSTAEGATTSDTCQLCGLGHYSASEGSSSSCSPCAAGSYADQVGLDRCAPCPANRLTPKPGATSAGSCLNPAANFAQGALALGAACLLSGTYILRGRMNAVAFGRKRHLQEAGKTYVALIRAVNRVPLDAEPEKLTNLQRRLMRAALVIGAVIAFVGSTFVCLAMMFAQVFFAAMIIWRNMRLIVHIPFMERVTAAVRQLDEVIGSVVPVRDLFGWIFVVVEAMGSLGINLSAMQVTCVGSQAPIVLLVNVILFVAIVILIECGVASFLATTFFRAHREYRSVILNSRARNTIDYPASVKARRWLFSNIETAIFSSNLVVYALQYAVSFISIGEFFQHNGRHASTPACDNISGVPGIDTALAIVSTVMAYLLIPAVMYNTSKLLVPRLLQKDKLPPKDLSSISHDTLVESIRNQPVTMTYSCIPSVDYFVSWRFKWAYNVLHAPKYTKADELMFLGAEDDPISPPTGIGICPAVSDTNSDFQKEWVEECEERLPHFGFRLVGASYYYFGTVMQNFCAFLLVLLGVWDADSVRKFNIINTLVYNGFEIDQYLQQPEYDLSSETPAWLSCAKLCFRTLCCFFRDINYRRVLPEDGGESSLQVAALVAAELSTRATLFLLFPFGSLITTYVSATAANPIFCSRAKKLNKLLPPLLVFDSDLLAKKRVEQMGGSYADWKIQAMSVYIFTTESRLIQYCYRLNRYLMGISLSLYPVLPFLVAGVVLTVVYGMVASIYPIVVLANLLEVNDDDDEAAEVNAAPDNSVTAAVDVESNEPDRRAGLAKQSSLSRPVTPRAASLRRNASAGTVSSEQEGLSKYNSEFYSGYDEDSDCEDESATERQTTDRAAAAAAFATAAGPLSMFGHSNPPDPRDLELVELQGANTRRTREESATAPAPVQEELQVPVQLAAVAVIVDDPGAADTELGVELLITENALTAESLAESADGIVSVYGGASDEEFSYSNVSRK